VICTAEERHFKCFVLVTLLFFIYHSPDVVVLSITTSTITSSSVSTDVGWHVYFVDGEELYNLLVQQCIYFGLLVDMYV
jgi:hypothetical protein